MDITTLLLFSMTASMFAATFHALRLVNARRVVALLGAVNGMCGVGTVAAAIL